MHPALSLAKRKLEDARSEFDQVMAIEHEIVPSISAMASTVSPVAVSALRATGIEGVYTGIEGVLKEILSQIDGGVFANNETWHAQLLAQAAEENRDAGRGPIISDRTYRLLDHLRGFRHVERNVYRHLLEDDGVVENLHRLNEVFPLVEQEIATFMSTYAPPED